MRIVLTHGYFLHEDPKEKEIMRPYPPLGILYISAYLKNKGVNVTVLDSTFMTKEDWEERITDLQPNLIACYSNLMTKLNVLQLVKFSKACLPDCITVVGGPDVTYNVENYLKSGFNYVVSGEGEETMFELIQDLLKGNSTNKVNGVSFLADNGTVHSNPERVRIRDVSEIPMPDREGIDLEAYLSVWKQYHGKRTVNVSTQRGCPYTCQWCSTAVYGQSYRRNSPKRVVQEILHLKENFGVEALWFVDDVFTVSHKWLSELHAEFTKHDLKIDFECITRAERLNDKVLDQLKDMGCFRIWIGAESGSQRIIDLMDRRVELNTVQSMMQATQEKGMQAGTFIMVGYPTETHEDILQTMEHIKKANPNLLTITQAYPIKGTGLYLDQEDEFVNEIDWENETDRDIKLKLPYSDKYYKHAIRYLVNGWIAHRDGSFTASVKSRVSRFLMNTAKN